MSDNFEEYRVFVGNGGSTTIEPAIPTTEELNAEIARLRERNEKLEACVKAADALRRSVGPLRRDWTETIRYDAARAALGEVEREG